MRQTGTLLAALLASLVLASCDDQPVPILPTQTGKVASSSSTSSGATTGGTSSSSVKVVFNKKGFYTNAKPNSLGCAGDAKKYYDPLTEREATDKPTWLRNVSVDVTNSNALYGPSNAASCGLNGLGAPAPSNCATFDDLQTLTGNNARAVLIGGFGCTTPGSTCTTAYLQDIWNLSLQQTAVNSSWGPQAASLPEIVSGSGKYGLAWAAGDFAEQSNQFYLYGGVTTNGVVAWNSNVVKVRFNQDGTADTSTVSQTPSTKQAYGGWLNTHANNTAPTAVSGASFTASLRRDPGSRTRCVGLAGGACDTASGYLTTNFYALNEHQDWFLLLGGADFAGTIYDDMFMYKPRGLSNSTTSLTPSTGDWNRLSKPSAFAMEQIQSVSTITPTSSSTTPVTVTTGSTFTGRAHHRVVYDPGMNRFYIFGGLKGTSINTAAITNETWVYDPPALGRRPNAACFVAATPSTSSNANTGHALPRTANTIYGTVTTSLDEQREWFAAKYAFPPGGCLQKMSLSTLPDARFEHAMAFDREQKAAVVFGGCIQAPGAAGLALFTASADPTFNCSSANALLSDTWAYIAPTNNEYSSKDATAASGPYSSTVTTRMANVLGLDHWLHWKSPTASAPNSADLTGAWVKLYPSTAPTKRVSALMSYDRSHHKFYLQGGYGCVDSACTTLSALNDLWEYTPPNFDTCTAALGTCTDQGTWTKLKTHDPTSTTQPTLRKGAIMAFAQPMFSHGDDYYTVTDLSCSGQGPISTSDPSVSRQYVGSIYVHVDRSQFKSTEMLLLNLRMLPFDSSTKLPSISENGTTYTTADDTDKSSTSDQAVIRVQLLSSPMKYESQIDASIQPRFHEFIAGTPQIASTFMYATGGTGQVTERQMLIPLPVDPSIDLIKIERVSGSVKYYELTVSKF